VATKKAKKQSKKSKVERISRVKFISAADLADQMDLSVRDHNPNYGEPNPKLMVLRSPDTSNEGKALLMDFMKRTGLRMVCHGPDRKRYVQGNCHWLVFLKKDEFKKAKAELVPPPVAPKEQSEDEDYDDEERGEGQQPSAPPRDVKQGLGEAARLASQLAQVLAKLAG
jgi:hypothetical protein